VPAPARRSWPTGPGPGRAPAAPWWCQADKDPASALRMPERRRERRLPRRAPSRGRDGTEGERTSRLATPHRPLGRQNRHRSRLLISAFTSPPKLAAFVTGRYSSLSNSSMRSSSRGGDRRPLPVGRRSPSCDYLAIVGITYLSTWFRD
jgi:hypothetical protein